MIVGKHINTLRGMFAASTIALIGMTSVFVQAQVYPQTQYPTAQTQPQAPQQNQVPSTPQSYITPYPSRKYATPPQGEPLETMVARRMKSKVPSGYKLRGAGFYVDWQGHVLTASHVVMGCKTFTVSDTYGATTEAIFIGADTTKDIAILRASTTLSNPFVIADYSYRGHTEVNAVGSMKSGGRENVKRTSIIGTLNLGKSSVMRVIPALDTGVSGAPLLNDFGKVSGMVVGRWGKAEAAESIATSGQDIIDFLSYHKISKAVPRSSGSTLFGASKKSVPVWSELRRSVMSIECKGA